MAARRDNVISVMLRQHLYSTDDNITKLILHLYESVSKTIHHLIGYIESAFKDP